MMCLPYRNTAEDKKSLFTGVASWWCLVNKTGWLGPMNTTSEQQEAIELLQRLGLKEYEARAFVALTRVPDGTAKKISEISAVPRTRVYDAVRVLETKGLVEIQHSNPKVFRAVPIGEAAATLQKEYAERAAKLQDSLEDIEPVNPEQSVKHEVWTLSGSNAIENRTEKLISEADQELLLILDHRIELDDQLVDQLAEAAARGVHVLIGTTDKQTCDQLRETLPDVSVFFSDIAWLTESPVPEDHTTIGRLLLIDQTTIMVSTFEKSSGESLQNEQAVFGRGFDNGIVAIIRRLMATGLMPLPEINFGN